MVREVSAPVDYCAPAQARGEKCIPIDSFESADQRIRVRSGRELRAVILAGGDGVRLRPLSRLISGDDRPKQFCPMFGDQSLLAHTRQRLAGLFEADKTLFVVTKAHESFYTDELADVDAEQIAVQPLNRGTGAAIAFALTRIMNGRDVGPDPIVAFFPADHYYADEDHFTAAIESALDAAARHPHSLVLLGAEATHPETEYGWIETEPIHGRSWGSQVHRVSRFWEKPSRDTAQDLFSQGSLWNTFVMIGRASAFLRALLKTVPGLILNFDTARRNGDAADAYHEGLASVDFSRHVLSRCASQLLVARMPASVGWSDLGAPERVLATLAKAGIGPRQLALSELYSPGVTDLDSIAAIA